MTTGTAAENLATAVPKKEEKIEKRRALGRGLESLLPGPRVVAPSVARPQATPTSAAVVVATESAPLGTTADSIQAIAEARETMQSQSPEEIASISAQATASRDVVASLAIDSIEKNPYQTRYLFDEAQLAELCDSIKQHGVVQPVVVRPAEEKGRYILVLGERRLRASKMAGKETIPALVRRLSPQQAAEMTVLENVMREDLNPIEQAEAYRVLSQQFNLTQAQIAQRIGVSRESVANYMRLLRLPEDVRNYVAQGQIGFSQARELLALENREYIPMVADELLTGYTKWDELQSRVAWLNGSIAPPQAQPQGTGIARWVDPNVLAAQMELERLLGVRVRIKDRKGKGHIVIEYMSVDDYERVVEMLRGKQQ
jgi:ParB family transcriptional regulator, chromosome partitioning protein